MVIGDARRAGGGETGLELFQGNKSIDINKPRAYTFGALVADSQNHNISCPYMVHVMLVSDHVFGSSVQHLLREITYLIYHDVVATSRQSWAGPTLKGTDRNTISSNA